MAVPVPTPTAEQIVAVAEIVMTTTDDALAMISSESDQDRADAKWALTLADIDAWPAIRSEKGDLKRVGNIEFFEGKEISTRLDFRNSIRSRYGLALLVSELYGTTAALAAGVSSLEWF
jgi:hypothetical protein